MLHFAKFLVVFILAAAPQAAQAATAQENKAVKKTIKILVNAIRYGKDDLAAKQVALEEMAQRLMHKEWSSMSDTDKKSFIDGLNTIVRKVSFKSGREKFKYLDAIVYDDAKFKGDDIATIKSTVVIHRNYKKSEIVITYALKKEQGKWRVFDTILVGESTIESIRLDQIEPLLKKGGVAAVMKALNDKVAELKTT